MSGEKNIKNLRIPIPEKSSNTAEDTPEDKIAPKSAQTKGRKFCFPEQTSPPEENGATAKPRQ